MRTELDYQWELVEDEISVVFKSLLKSVKELLTDLKEALLRKFGACIRPVANLSQYLH